MKKTLFFISIGLIFSCLAHAEMLSEKPHSVLYLDHSEYQNSNDHKTQHFDFSNALQRAREHAVKQNQSSYIRMNENQSNTANMSSFERSQYFLKSHDNQALKTEENMQNLRSLEKAKNRGVISNKEYNQGVAKTGQYNPFAKDQKQSAKFTFGE